MMNFTIIELFAFLAAFTICFISFRTVAYCFALNKPTFMLTSISSAPFFAESAAAKIFDFVVPSPNGKFTTVPTFALFLRSFFAKGT
jgi:hypothetical protein